MSDRITETIAALLSKHYLWDADSEETIARCRCDVDNPSITNGVEDGGWMPFGDHSKHVAALFVAALKAARIALIELPEPCPPPSDWDASCMGAWEAINLGADPVSLWPGKRNQVALPDGAFISAAAANDLAAALLAAAEKADTHA